MRIREQYKHMLNFSANLITLIVDAVLFGWVWYSFYALWEMHKIGEISQYAGRGNWAVIAIYMLFIFLLTNVFGGYKIGYMRVADIILSNILALILGNIVAYFLLCLVCRDYVNPVPLIAVAVIEMVFISIWNMLIRVMYKAIYPPRQMLLIYGDYGADWLIQKINTRRDKYDICDSVKYDIDVLDLYNKINQYKAVVLCDLPDEQRNLLFKYCYMKGIRTYVTPKITDVLFRGADDIHLFDTPLYLSRNQGLTIDQRFFKRTMDIILSLIGIVVASPFMLIIAIAIKLYDGGPVIYRQTRLTRDNKEFQILKFRSMKVAEPGDKKQITAKDDDRITPVGRIIRNIHFDELPQLFNILKGEMSMVGPRPEWKHTTEKYTESVPEFKFRLKVKAGLTGYAQVWGKYNTTPYDKLKLDMTYIENYSIWLDIKLILMTVKCLFMKDNTEGIDGNQTTALSEEKHEKTVEEAVAETLIDDGLDEE